MSSADPIADAIAERMEAPMVTHYVVEVDFDHGDHARALAALEDCVERVRAQIAESHAPTWDGPRKVGEE